jgi:hypothetical protein
MASLATINVSPITPLLSPPTEMRGFAIQKEAAKSARLATIGSADKWSEREKK